MDKSLNKIIKEVYKQVVFILLYHHWLLKPVKQLNQSLIRNNQMSNTNVVTWSLALCSSNSAKIDAVNRIIIGDDYTQSDALTATVVKAEPEVKETTTSEKASSNESINFDVFKAAAKTTKDEFGNDFAMDVLKATGLSLGTSLARSLSKVDEANYADIMATWSNGPVESDSAEDDDDDFADEDDGLGDGDADVTSDAVKTALKAYAKDVGRDEAKDLMAKYKVKSLAGVDDLDAKKLAALFAETLAE